MTEDASGYAEGPPSPAALLHRLVAVYKVETEEDLAGKTPNSLRTLKRWKAEGYPQNVRSALDLLGEAGLLRSPGEAGGEGEDPGLALTRLGAAVGTLVATHREALEQLADVRERLGELAAAQSAAQARTRPRRRKGP